MIMGIDPGTHTMGMALLRTDSQLRLTRIQAHTLTPWIAANHNPFITTQQGVDRIGRCTYLAEIIVGWCRLEPIGVIAIEEPFFNAMAPRAYSALYMNVRMIEDIIHSYIPSMVIIPIAPTQAKAAVQVSGTTKFKGKDLVKQALSCHPEIGPLLGNIELYSEHALDAVAIAYTQLVNVRNTIEAML